MKEKYKEMETMKENIRAMENISRKPNMWIMGAPEGEKGELW